ncbi:MAG TPA: NUDIX domain-containing protein [Sphingobacterium sp.]|nr:NUDIX domain-containing protein [Sphingobacterium sp.]
MKTDRPLYKVTCFITREKLGKKEILLLQHPTAGIQFPAGTVEIDENFTQAAILEAYEETGLKEFVTCKHIGHKNYFLPGKNVVLQKAAVFSRPNVSSNCWASIRRGVIVKKERYYGDFTQISYIEGNKYPNPDYITYQITGWMESCKLTSKIQRHFYHLHTHSTLDNWEHEADKHVFKLFWSPINNLPPIVFPQNQWLEYVLTESGYLF